MVRLLAGMLTAVALAGTAGCALGPPSKPPGLPPSPRSVTLKNPGGDAADPELAALTRLATERWGTKYDRYGTLKVPLVDWRHWQRVKLWRHPTRAAFRFGDDHFGIIALWYKPTQGKDDPEACIARFMGDATPEAKMLGAHVTDSRRIHTSQMVDGEPRAMVIELLEGSVESMFDSNDYVGAVVAYQSWPGTCLVQGFAVMARRHRDLAIKVRDRWVNEGAQRLRWARDVTNPPPPLAR